MHVYRGSRRDAGFGVLLRTLEISRKQHDAATAATINIITRFLYANVHIYLFINT